MLLLSFCMDIYSDDNVLVKRIPTKEDAAYAMSLYKSKKYKQAKKIYTSLAKIGDNHAQYMLSILSFHGLGEAKNPIKAYGWAKLSQNSQISALQKNFKKIKHSLSQEEIKYGEKLYKELESKFSDLVIANRYSQLFEDKTLECTGSRIKGNCGNIQINCGGVRSHEGIIIPLTKKNEVKCIKQKFDMNIVKIEHSKDSQKIVADYIEKKYTPLVTVEKEQ